MQKTHKINVISAWICKLALWIITIALQGWNRTTITIGIAMISAAVLLAVLLFIKVNDTFKGIFIVSVVGLATLFISIMQGGSSRTFIASFFVLSMATLYFKAVIIISYTAIYLTACLIAAVVNPLIWADPIMSLEE